jgi:ADP-ribosyl-[dinitrogen reductase] hydrolase
VSESVTQRVEGMVLGGALGDGWGRPYEGQAAPEGTLPAALVITDDTELTLATCEGLLQAGRVDPKVIAERFVLWHREGRLHGLGASTTKALRDLEAGVHWALAGAKGERAGGNGAAMRVAPLAFLVDPEDDFERRHIRDVARITHHHDEAQVGALAVAAAVRFAATPGYPMARLLTDVCALLPDTQVRDRLQAYGGLGSEVRPVDLGRSRGHSGFAADSVPLALFAAREIGRRSFADVVVDAIRAGGDTDTIGAITGQIAGAAVGLAGLPSEALARLRDREAITDLAERFARLVERMTPRTTT